MATPTNQRVHQWDQDLDIDQEAVLYRAAFEAHPIDYQSWWTAPMAEVHNATREPDLTARPFCLWQRVYSDTPNGFMALRIHVLGNVRWC